MDEGIEKEAQKKKLPSELDAAMQRFSERQREKTVKGISDKLKEKREQEEQREQLSKPTKDRPVLFEPLNDDERLFCPACKGKMFNEHKKNNRVRRWYCAGCEKVVIRLTYGIPKKRKAGIMYEIKMFATKEQAAIYVRSN